MMKKIKKMFGRLVTSIRPVSLGCVFQSGTLTKCVNSFNIQSNYLKNINNNCIISKTGCQRSYHSTTNNCMGIEEFFDPERKAGEPFVSGRSWTVVDLRRKDFDDLHKLWYVLYKERNLLLSLKAKYRRSGRPIAQLEDNRYIKVKRSMAAIKHVLGERQKIGNKIKELNSIIENENQNNDIQKK